MATIGGPVPVFGDFSGGGIVFYIECCDTHLASLAGQLAFSTTYVAKFDPIWIACYLVERWVGVAKMGKGDGIDGYVNQIFRTMYSTPIPYLPCY